jgi:hypothetical protein
MKFTMSYRHARRDAGKASTGCIIAAAVAGVLGVIVVVVAIGVLGFGFYYAGSSPSSSASPTAGSPSKAPSSSGGSAYEKPSPTPAQSASVASGKSFVWSDQGLGFTVPEQWTKQTEDKNTLSWSGPGYGAHLIVSISPMGNDFPVDTSLDAYYSQATQRMTSGEVRQVKRLDLDGVKGIQFYEDTPSSRDDPQRLQWLGYRNYLGQTQMINIILSTKGSEASKYEDTLYGILYSTKIPH